MVKRRNGIKRSPILLTIRSSPFGPFALLWSDHGGQPKICRIFLSKPDLSAPQAVKETFPGITSSACIEIDEVADQIEAFLQGGGIRFFLERTRFDLCSMFPKMILRGAWNTPRIRKHLPTNCQVSGEAIECSRPWYGFGPEPISYHNPVPPGHTYRRKAWWVSRRARDEAAIARNGRCYYRGFRIRHHASLLLLKDGSV